ncbi:Type III restriction enzyme, res subunit [Seminavis robusta]|uniref:Type III restriction enzyme, res subunit n=1 Tax=Seminavis robusta TaxID=568900 RepID=A0A9N8H9X4_9STRA|nr:Type III restriction enzyme, res subunit [Seminavis robusta]|eukprot:Sro221_g090890.1 Type III restriction enzyme, res subunit (301) ;mRNA; r:15438-16340
MATPTSTCENHDNVTTTTTNVQDRFLRKVIELYEYQQVHGDTMVPRGYPANRPLANFVSKQRQLYRKGLLSEERIEILNRLDFVWKCPQEKKDRPPPRKPTNQEWTACYQELANGIDDWLERLRSNGTANENGYSYIDPDSSLEIPHHAAIMIAVWRLSRNRSIVGLWLAKQRTDHQAWMTASTTTTSDDGSSHALFSQGKLDQLNQLDPHWQLGSRDRQWMIRFHTLQAYQQTFGDTLVPIGWAQSPPLAHWVSNQRKNYNLKQQRLANTLTDQRQALLESIGFVWDRWEFETLSEELL